MKPDMLVGLHSKLRFFFRLWKSIDVEKVTDSAGKTQHIARLREATYGNVIAYDSRRKELAFTAAPEEFRINLAVKKFTERIEKGEFGSK